MLKMVRNDCSMFASVCVTYSLESLTEHCRKVANKENKELVTKLVKKS